MGPVLRFLRSFRRDFAHGRDTVHRATRLQPPALLLVLPAWLMLACSDSGVPVVSTETGTGTTAADMEDDDPNDGGLSSTASTDSTGGTDTADDTDATSSTGSSSGTDSTTTGGSSEGTESTDDTTGVTGSCPTGIAGCPCTRSGECDPGLSCDHNLWICLDAP
mgnify:FL=1